MHDPTADTAVATGGSDDTEPSTPGGAPRIRPSRPRDAGGADYDALSTVDPAHYVLQREIARGGMGRIHVARDRRLGREVALKEVLTDAAAARRRFEREARITARLQHPSIVAVHEAGLWPSGEPFYAMRLVTGRSLDDAIAQAGTLDARIALVPNVLAIADAMAYAHGQRVIHRDLKPKNIVVGEFGETVVIDWGLAKDLAADPTGTSSSFERAPTPAEASGSGSGSAPGETTVGDVLGTPAYMPPEQAAGKPVDERADVYAIGAILYHLLAGRAPYSGDTKTQLLTAVNVAPPPPLAGAAPGVPSELVAIVEHAMARDQAERYATARELAEDLRRFQTGQLVGAHRYSLRQLLGRWMRRHRTALVAGAAALIVAIVIGVVAVSRIVAANRRAERQRETAVSNQKKSEELMQFMLDDLAQRLRRAGRLDLIDSIAHRAAAYYDERGAESDDDQRLAADSRERIGGVLEKRGDAVGAAVELEKARVGYALLAGRRADAPTLVELARVTIALSRVADLAGDSALAARRARDGLDAARLAAGASPHGNGVDRVLADGHRVLAGIAEERGDLDGALAEYREMLALARTETEPAVAAKLEINGHSDIWRIHRKRNELADALAEAREVLRISAAAAARFPEDTMFSYDLASAHGDVGLTLIDQKDLAGAEAELAAGALLIDQLVRLDPSNGDWADGRSDLYEKIGMVRFARKDYVGAGAAYRTAHDIAVELAARNPSNADAQRSESMMANKLGDVQLALGDTASALVTFRGALATRERLVAKDPSNMAWRRDLFYSHIKIGEALDELPQQRRAAVDELKTALSIAEEIAARTPDNAASAADVAGTHDEIGDVLVHLHDVAGARAEYTTALAQARAIAARRPTTGQELVDSIAGKLAKLDQAGAR